jgi:hypothetical protein
MRLRKLSPWTQIVFGLQSSVFYLVETFAHHWLGIVQRPVKFAYLFPPPEKKSFPKLGDDEKINALLNSTGSSAVLPSWRKG